MNRSLLWVGCHDGFGESKRLGLRFKHGPYITSIKINKRFVKQQMVSFSFIFLIMGLEFVEIPHINNKINNK